MTEAELFGIVGYLASQIRSTKLDIETHPNKSENFEA